MLASEGATAKRMSELPDQQAGTMQWSGGSAPASGAVGRALAAHSPHANSFTD